MIPSNVPTSLPTFGPPPLVQSVVALNATSTSVVIKAIVNIDSILYCSIVKSNSEIGSASNILKPNLFAYSYNRTAQLVLTNLVPITNYTVYCVAVSEHSFNYVRNMTYIMKYGMVRVTTLCCKSIVVTANSLVLREDSYMLSALNIAISSNPSNAIQLQVQSSNTSLLMIYPDVVRITNSSVLNELSFDFVSLFYGQVNLPLLLVVQVEMSMC